MAVIFQGQRLFELFGNERHVHENSVMIAQCAANKPEHP
jgi:hypothetical protein